MGAPDLVPDDPASLAAKQEVTAEVERRLATATVSAWLERLGAVGVPCGPVLLRETALADAQARANGLGITIEQPGIGPVSLLGPLHLVGHPEPSDDQSQGAAAPALGEHTDEVLAEL